MKQITEDYVSYETAVLLKEKGFDEKCIGFYTCTEKPYFMEASCRNNWTYEKHGSINAPTHQMALKWLREVHKIVLDIVFETNKGWTFYVSHLITKEVGDGSTYIVDIQHCVWSDDVQQPYYNEYEQAVEAALLYVLKNLI